MTVVVDERHEFKIKVLAIDRGCVASSLGACDGELRAHHVIYQKHLRREGLDHLLWDPCNGAALCEHHHRRHHAGYQPIPRRLLPTRCIMFANDYGLGVLLDRFYDA
jgi:hypothetical protein